MKTLFASAAVTLVAIAAFVGPTQATTFCDPDPDCVCGESTVTLGTGEFEGYWCYTINVAWNAPRGLSHVNILTDLPPECRCFENLIAFPDPAGESEGFEEAGDTTPCSTTYSGEYECEGDPSLSSPLDEIAAIKFTPQGCDDKIGTGTFVFYSQAGPVGDENTVHTMVIVDKNGPGECTGSVTGPLPGLECSVHTGSPTWGEIKGKFGL